MPRMSRPLLSIIVPCYNHAPYLEDRFASIFSQNADSFELIVLDDASQDKSVSIIQDVLAGKPYTLVVNKVNSGSPFRQWERGLDLATGKYVWIAESDDSCESSFLSSLLCHMQRDSFVLSCAKSRTIDSAGNLLPGTFWPELLDSEFFGRNQALSCNDFLYRFMGSRNCIPSANAVVFRVEGMKNHVLAAVRSVSRYNYVGDWIFWARLLRIFGARRMSYSADPLAHHRQHLGTTRALLRRECEKERILEYSTAINYIHSLRDIFSFIDIAQALCSGSWDWTYDQYITRYKPSWLERLTGYPQRGIHRVGYLGFRLRRLNDRC
jgi:glycosyltransferase involved in cell wall biosynthesis